ncbi:hypothetical protein [Sphingomonas soli]|uniref:hypothetical protein n=1 Tax=Sphingomonas soli TaxID=266127 RepID=UPI00083795C2|nr:hypothetical protein [Sphingomonas soli]
MLGLGLMDRIGRPPDPAAAALIGRMSEAPGAARASLIDTAVRALKASGVWDKMDCCWVMAAHHAQAGLLNWKGAGNMLAALGAMPAFTADRGYQGDGATQLLDTGFVPGAGMTLTNNHHLSVWCLSEARDSIAQIATDTLSIASRTPIDTLATRSASVGVDPGPSLDGRGMWLISRASGSGYSRYHNGILADAPAAASSEFGGVHPVYICGRNAAGTPAYNGTMIAAATIGAALNADEQSALHRTLRAYLAALGAA